MKLVGAGLMLALVVGLGVWWAMGSTTVVEIQSSRKPLPADPPTPHIVLCQLTARSCERAPSHERH
jgi:hypothetical protein